MEKRKLPFQLQKKHKTTANLKQTRKLKYLSQAIKTWTCFTASCCVAGSFKLGDVCGSEWPQNTLHLAV